MGVIDRVLGTLLGNGNVIAETAEVFRENAEAAAQRDSVLTTAVLDQFAAEFAHPGKGRFDAVMDGINRIPRPALALGTLGLFVAAIVDPLWFAERMVGLSVVPEPLWWLLGAVVSFYFGARHQAKGQAFQRDIAAALARTPDAGEAIRSLRTLRKEPADEQQIAPAPQPGVSPPPDRTADRTADQGADRPETHRGRAAVAAGPAATGSGNAALDDWRARHG